MRVMTDMGTGVERHGTISFPADLEVRFMAAVLDVNGKELAKVMEGYLSDNGYTVMKKNKGSIISIK